MNNTYFKIIGPLDWFFRVAGYGLSCQRIDKRHRHYYSVRKKRGIWRPRHVFGLCLMLLQPVGHQAPFA